MGTNWRRESGYSEEGSAGFFRTLATPSGESSCGKSKAVEMFLAGGGPFGEDDRSVAFTGCAPEAELGLGGSGGTVPGLS